MVEFSDLFDCEVDEFQKKAKVTNWPRDADYPRS